MIFAFVSYFSQIFFRFFYVDIREELYMFIIFIVFIMDIIIFIYLFFLYFCFSNICFFFSSFINLCNLSFNCLFDFSKELISFFNCSYFHHDNSMHCLKVLSFLLCEMSYYQFCRMNPFAV